MKKAAHILIFLLLALCIVALVACNGTQNGGNTEGGGKTEGNGSQDGGMTACQHSFGEWETVKEATCKAAGVRARTCAGCLETEEEAIPKSDEHMPGAEANGVVLCSVCSALLEDNRLYTVTYKVGDTVLKSASYKAGEEITLEAPTPNMEK